MSVTSWSYSRLSVFRKCPRQFKYKFIDKLPTDDNYAASRGFKMHKLAEGFVKGEVTGKPKELMPFIDELQGLKEVGADTEVDLTVTQAWHPTTFDDWNNAWCRGSADAVVEIEASATVIDYKTGKIYPDDHEEQGKLYSTLLFIHNEDIEKIDVEFWYFDQDDILSFQYTRDQLDDLIKYWIDTTKPVFREKNWPCNTGSHCRWCDFSASKGGPCKY